MSVYESVYSWLIAMKSGGCLDSIASVIVSHLLSDIWYKQTDVLLKGMNNYLTKSDLVLNNNS